MNPFEILEKHKKKIEAYKAHLDSMSMTIKNTERIMSELPQTSGDFHFSISDDEASQITLIWCKNSANKWRIFYEEIEWGQKIHFKPLIECPIAQREKAYPHLEAFMEGYFQQLPLIESLKDINNKEK